MGPITRPSIIVSRDTMKPSAPVRTHDFLYKESKRAKLEREKEERRRRREVEIEFAPEDLALATPANNQEESQAICLLGEEGRQVLGIKNQEHDCSKEVARGSEAEVKPDCSEGGFLGEGECRSEEGC